MRVGADQGAETLAKTGGVLIRSIVNYRTSHIVDVAEHGRGSPPAPAASWYGT